MKKCKNCNILKPLDQFYPKKHGNGKYYLSSICKPCQNIYQRKYIDKYRKTDKAKQTKKLNRIKWMKDPLKREKLKNWALSSNRRNIKTTMLGEAKRRAIKNDLEFNINKQDIIIPEFCPILEVPFKFGDKINYFYSPSLDRIDTTKGYIKGNIRVISMLANTMKNAATKEQILTFCKNIIKYINNDDIVQTIENTKSIESKDKEP